MLVESRYPDDTHDRLWFNYTDSSWKAISTGSDIGGFTFEVPSPVLQTAAVPSIANSSIDLTWSTSDKLTIFFVLLHFVEIEVLQNTSLREFHIYANGEKLAMEPPPLKYLMTAYYLYTHTGHTNYNVSIKSSPRATLPPILNAFELYTVLQVTMLPTDTRDGISLNFFILSSVE